MINDKQKKAIKELEKAFVKCHKAGLAIHGMDCNIIGYDEEQLNATTIDMDGDQYAAMDKLSSSGEDIQITAKAYKDSGGW
jgi:hypothetical protein